MDILSNFHFLRPWWLLLSLPAGLLFFFLHRKEKSRHEMENIIAPHLLNHLLMGRGKQGLFGPLYLLAALWLLAIIAGAGPSWQRAPSPFSQEGEGLVIVLKVTPSMLARDVQPSRLARSVQKIQDLMALRAGGKTALIAYRGSAHLVMPLTHDPAIITMFAQALSPEIMPQEGGGLPEALALAGSQLSGSGVSGSILLLVDEIREDELTGLAEFSQKNDVSIHILAVAGDRDSHVPADSPPAPPLDLTGLNKGAAALDASLIVVSPDDRDVRKLAGQIKSSLRQAEMSEGEQWQDGGYLLLPLLLPLALFFFRRGVTVTHG